MTDKNEKYVYETDKEMPADEKPIIRTFDSQQQEIFTIKELKAQIERIEEQRSHFDAQITEIQDKIDEATAALVVVK